MVSLKLSSCPLASLISGVLCQFFSSSREAPAPGQVMTSSVACVRPGTTVREALVVFNSHNCRHLPVVDDDKVVGLLSIRDVTAALVEDREHQIEELTDYIYGSYGRHAGVG